MKYLFIVLALIAVLSFFWLKQPAEPPMVVTNLPLKARTPTNLETKTASEGGITIAVTPQSLTATGWDFKITLDTHTENLDADLTKTATLVADQKQEYKPESWTGDPPGGHHREGILKFPVLPAGDLKKPQTFSLKINGLGGVAERIFSWSLY